MNITKQVIDFPLSRKAGSRTLNKIRKDLGIKFCRREINILIKESKNVNNITGHDLISTTRCLITNFCINDRIIGDKKYKVYSKITYICELEFPGIITKHMIETNLEKVLISGSVYPIYAFSNHQAENEEGVMHNYGMTMIDLSSGDSGSFGVMNFSDNSKSSQLTFKEIIYKDFYNPKYYTNDECECLGDERENRNGLITEYIDDNTTIVYNPLIRKEVSLKKDDIGINGIFINNRTVKTGKLINSLFSELLFIPIEELSFVYNSRYPENTDENEKLNMKRIVFFTRFPDTYRSECLDEIIDIVIKEMKAFVIELGDNNEFYLEFNSDNSRTVIDVYFYKTREDLKIAVPNEKLYSEYALSSEIILNNIEYDGEYAKLDFVDTAAKNSFINGVENNNNKLLDVIDMLDSHTMTKSISYDERRKTLLE